MEANRILVVEDDEDILATYEYLLADAGYQVCLSLTGESIFELINATHPDLVLLDLRLGELDGGELCKSIKYNPETCTIPIILVSAETNLAFIKETSGADDFVAKPFDIDHLLSRVNKLLER